MMRLLSILFICFLLFSSCSSDDGNILLRELTENRELWQSKQIKDYKLTESKSCYCLAVVFEWDVLVENGVKYDVEFDASLLPEEVSYEFAYEQVFNDSKTIEETFDFVEELLNKNLGSLAIEYHPIYGFPTLIDIDYIKEAIDDELAFSYANFIEN